MYSFSLRLNNSCYAMLLRMYEKQASCGYIYPKPSSVYWNWIRQGIWWSLYHDSYMLNETLRYQSRWPMENLNVSSSVQLSCHLRTMLSKHTLLKQDNQHQKMRMKGRQWFYNNTCVGHGSIRVAYWTAASRTIAYLWYFWKNYF